MPSLELWQSSAVALAIGLLIGAERERSKHSSGSPGIRTFALVVLLGNLATLAPPVVAGVALGGVLLLVSIDYATQERDHGLTSEMALLVTMVLGYVSRTEAALAVGVSVATVVLLMSKDSLHRFVRDTVTDLEESDAVKFFVAAFVVLPLLPAGHIGPYGVWVPQRVWLLVVMITGIGWIGYAATRALGASRGLLIAGFAGGFVSGTATTGSMGARSRHDKALAAPALAGAVMASCATLLQLLVVTAVADPRVTAAISPAVLTGSAVLGAEAWWLGRRAATTSERVNLGRPFALLPGLLLAAVISGVLLLATWMDRRYGSSGAALATAVGSLADVHAAAAAVATLAHQQSVTVAAATHAIALGLVANTVGKLVAAGVGGGIGFAGRLSVCFVPAAAAVAAALQLTG